MEHAIQIVSYDQTVRPKAMMELKNFKSQSSNTS